MTRQTLVETLEITMRLLHPFMPFITEEIWQTIPHEGESIVIQSYPASNAAWKDSQAEQLFTLLEQTVSLVRTGRVLLNYPPGQSISFSVSHEDQNKHRQLQQLERHLTHLSRGAAGVAPQSAWPKTKLLRLVTEGLSIGLVVSGDVDLKKALDRIVKQQEEQEKEVGRLVGKLGNREFVAKAPAEVIADHQTRLQGLRSDQAILTSSEQQLRAMLGSER
jgi:valyl-tRNA synthetase